MNRFCTVFLLLLSFQLYVAEGEYDYSPSNPDFCGDTTSNSVYQQTAFDVSAYSIGEISVSLPYLPPKSHANQENYYIDIIFQYGVYVNYWFALGPDDDDHGEPSECDEVDDTCDCTVDSGTCSNFDDDDENDCDDCGKFSVGSDNLGTPFSDDACSQDHCDDDDDDDDCPIDYDFYTRRMTQRNLQLTAPSNPKSSDKPTLYFYNENDQSYARVKLHVVWFSENDCNCTNGGSCTITDPDDEDHCLGYIRGYKQPYGNCLVDGNMPSSYYQCNCVNGWAGENCQECSFSCNNGVCVDLYGVAGCQCNAGYTGSYCNETTCSDLPDGNCEHGQCVGPDECQCYAGFAGDSCNTCALSCGPGKCNVLNETTAYCNCSNTGFTGVACTDPLPSLINFYVEAMCGLMSNDPDAVNSNAGTCCNYTLPAGVSNETVTMQKSCCVLFNSFNGYMNMMSVNSSYVLDESWSSLFENDVKEAGQLWEQAGEDLQNYLNSEKDSQQRLDILEDSLNNVQNDISQLNSAINICQSIITASQTTLTKLESSFNTTSTKLIAGLNTTLQDIYTIYEGGTQLNQKQMETTINLLGGAAICLFDPSAYNVITELTSTINAGINFFSGPGQGYELEEAAKNVQQLLNDVELIVNSFDALMDPNIGATEKIPILYYTTVAVNQFSVYLEAMAKGLFIADKNQLTLQDAIEVNTLITTLNQFAAVVQNLLRVTLQQQQFYAQLNSLQSMADLLQREVNAAKASIVLDEIGALYMELRYVNYGVQALKYFYEEAQLFDFYEFETFMPSFCPTQFTGGFSCMAPTFTQLSTEQCTLCCDGISDSQKEPNAVCWSSYNFTKQYYPTEFQQFSTSGILNVNVPMPNITLYSEVVLLNIYAVVQPVLGEVPGTVQVDPNVAVSGKSITSSMQIDFIKAGFSIFQLRNCYPNPSFNCLLSYSHNEQQWEIHLETNPISLTSQYISLSDSIHYSPYGEWSVDFNTAVANIDPSKVDTITFYFLLEYYESTSTQGGFNPVTPMIGDFPIADLPCNGGPVTSTSFYTPPSTLELSDCEIDSNIVCNPCAEQVQEEETPSSIQIPSGLWIHPAILAWNIDGTKSHSFQGNFVGTLGENHQFDITLPSGIFSSNFNFALQLDSTSGCNTDQVNELVASPTPPDVKLESLNIGFSFYAFNNTDLLDFQPSSTKRAQISISSNSFDFDFTQGEFLTLYQLVGTQWKPLQRWYPSQKKRDENDQISFVATLCNTQYHLFKSTFINFDNESGDNSTPKSEDNSTPSSSNALSYGTLSVSSSGSYSIDNNSESNSSTSSSSSDARATYQLNSYHIMGLLFMLFLILA